MERTCAAILSYGKVSRIRQVIGALSGVPVFVFNTTKSWWDESQEDYTEEMIKGLDVTLVRDEWKSQHEALNYAKNYCKELGYELMLIFDTDEVVENLPELFKFVEKNPRDAYCATLVDYAKDGTTVLKERGHKPIIAVKTGHNGEFYDKRCYRGWWDVAPGIKVHHFSLSNDEEYKYKINNSRYGDDFPPTEYKEEV